MRDLTREAVLSRGVDYVRTTVLGFIEAELPRLIDMARMQWGMDEYTLPYPARYYAYDPEIADTYPTVGMFTPNKRGIGGRTSIDSSGANTYTVRYAGRLFVSARTPMLADGTWQQDPSEKIGSMKVRDGLIQLIESLLKEWPSCGTGGTLYMDESDPPPTIDYMEPTHPNSQSKRWVSSGLLSADFVVHETTFIPTLGVAETISTEARLFAPHRVEIGQATETDIARPITGG